MAYVIFIMLLVLAGGLFIYFASRKKMRDGAKMLIVIGICMPLVLFLFSSPYREGFQGHSWKVDSFLDREINYPNKSYGPTVGVPFAFGIGMIALGSSIILLGRKEAKKPEQVNKE